MNKLNPIYILALVITLFIVSISMLNSKKEQFHSLDKEAKTLSVKAKDFKVYKNTWFNQQKVSKKLDLILRNSSFKNEKILKTQNKNTIKVKIQSNDPIVLNRFLNRVLNERFALKKIDIQKRSISFEIGFK